jgi:hypothetical protein
MHHTPLLIIAPLLLIITLPIANHRHPTSMHLSRVRMSYKSVSHRRAFYRRHPVPFSGSGGEL